LESLRYLDAVRKLTRTGTDYAVAKLLGVSEESIARYRKGQRVMDDYAALKIAQLLGVDPHVVIAAANFDREQDATRKGEWGKHLKKLEPSHEASCNPETEHDAAERGHERSDEEQGELPLRVAAFVQVVARLIERLGFGRFPALRAPSGPGCPARAARVYRGAGSFVG